MKFILVYGKAGALFAGASLLALSGALPARADYQSTVLSQNPVAYWRLNETTPPPVPPILAANAGSVGAGGNGTYNNGVIRGVSGAIAGDANPAARFPQSAGNRVRVPYASQWNQTGPFSVEFWAKPAQTAALACPAASVEFIPSPTQRNGWLIYQGDSTLGTGNGFVFRQYNSTGLANQTGVSTNIALDTSKWYHVVATFDGTNLKLYLNGALGPSAPIAGTARANTNSAIPLAFGARSDGSQGFFEYAGDLDECAVYTSALSASQVLTHYQAGTNPAPVTAYSAVVLGDSPAGYWRLGEPGDPAAANLGSLGSAANGKYIYNAMPNQTGPNPSSSPTVFPGFDAGNKAVGFDGFSGSVTIPALNLNTNTVSLTCWINGSAQNPSAPVFFNNAGTSAAGLQFDHLGGLNLAYNWNNIPSGVNWTSNVAINDSQWTFAALIIQPDKAVLYVPGQTPATNFAVHPVLPLSGQSFIGFNGTTNFNGSIDEVAIFNRSLSIGEAYSQYATAVGGLGPQIFAGPSAPANPLYAGDTLNLVVDAGGTPNLTYQWRKNSSPIGGATSSAYSKANITTGDSGTYDVVINNAFNTATSAGAVITVNAQTAPSITKAPVGRTLYPGGTLSLGVVATGGGLQYQWIKNGSPISGATTSTYGIASVTTNDAGSYSVTVSNSLGSPSAGPAVISVPILTNGTYAAVIAADGPEAWWRLDETSGNALIDAMGRHDGFYSNSNGGLTLGAAGAVSNGIFGSGVAFSGTADFGLVPYSPALNTADFTIECWVLASNVVNFITPVSSHNTPRSGYGFTTQSSQWYGFIGLNDVNYVVPTGGTPETAAVWPVVANQWVQLTLTFSASAGLRFYINGLWDNAAYVDFTRNASGDLIIGALGHGPGTTPDRNWIGRVDEVAVYTKSLSAAQALAHYNAGIFVPNAPPVFTSNPQSFTAVAGSNATFTATVGGTTPLAYQWLKGGVPISGRTTTTLGLTNLYYTDAGNYSLRASNVAGVVTSSVAVLTVVPFPSFANVTNGLVVHLPFDGAYGDTSGRGNNATPQGFNGGAPSFVTGKIGSQALHYFTLTDTGLPNNGSNPPATVTNNGYASLGPAADLQFGTTASFSVAYWVRLPTGYVAGDLPFLCSAPNSYGNFGVTLAPSYQAGGWSWSLGNSSSFVGVYGPNNSINNGAWHHLVHTFDRAGNGVTYLDGVQVNATPIVGVGDIDSTLDFNIGQDGGGQYPEQGSADIDDLGVWRRVLTQAEAQNMYLVGQYLGRSFNTYGPVTITTRQSGNNLDISWQAGTLLESTSINGPWSPVAGASAPFYRVVVPTTGNKFYKVQL